MLEKLINKIEPPKFTLHLGVDTLEINEYELRQFQLDVAKNNISRDVSVRCILSDCNGNPSFINKDGTLSDPLQDLSLTDTLAMDLFNHNHNIL